MFLCSFHLLLEHQQCSIFFSFRQSLDSFRDGTFVDLDRTPEVLCPDGVSLAVLREGLAIALVASDMLIFGLTLVRSIELLEVSREQFRLDATHDAVVDLGPGQDPNLPYVFLYGHDDLC